MTDDKKEHTGPKAFGAVTALLAVIAGVYAMIEPMGQRIDFAQNENAETRSDLKDHEGEIAHPGILERHARNAERFKEIETQFDAMDARIEQYEDWVSWWYRNVPGLDATQNERLRHLEAAVYGNRLGASRKYRPPESEGD